MKYYGPYMVSKRIGKCNYVIDTPDRRKKSRLSHINLLKPYDTRAPQSTVCLVPRVEVGEEKNEDDGVGWGELSQLQLGWIIPVPWSTSKSH